MTLDGVPVRVIVEALVRYGRYRSRQPVEELAPLLQPAQGRAALTVAERTMALKIDGGLRRLGVRCLARSVVVAQMLRSRGVAATVSLSVARADVSAAHAEVSVGGAELRPIGPTSVHLR